MRPRQRERRSGNTHRPNWAAWGTTESARGGAYPDTPSMKGQQGVMYTWCSCTRQKKGTKTHCSLSSVEYTEPTSKLRATKKREGARTKPHLGEKGLDLVLEGEVERLGGEVPDHVGGVPSPEGRDTLLLLDTREAAFLRLVGVVTHTGKIEQRSRQERERKRETNRKRGGTISRGQQPSLHIARGRRRWKRVSARSRDSLFDALDGDDISIHTKPRYSPSLSSRTRHFRTPAKELERLSLPCKLAD